MSWPGLVLITGGGTGGHVFPGLAAARALEDMGASVHWLGTRRGMESRLVTAAGIPLSYLRVSGVRGKNLWQRVLAPLLLLFAVLQACWVIMRLKPACVLGTGGFVAAPGGLAAWLLRRPLVIHEQNAVAGTTNRLLARFADRVLCGFPDVFEAAERVHYVGNPVRQEIAAVTAPVDRLAARQGRLRLLVIGGSQGSRAINCCVAEALALLPAPQRPETWHQCGAVDLARCSAQYEALNLEVCPQTFIDNMPEAYAWADLVLCRAGALTVAEIAAAGTAALFVPLPNAIDDHQRLNAAWLAEAGAAMQVAETQLSPQWLAGQLEELARDRARLMDMARRARELARPDAALLVAGYCRELGSD